MTFVHGNGNENDKPNLENDRDCIAASKVPEITKDEAEKPVEKPAEKPANPKFLLKLFLFLFCDLLSFTVILPLLPSILDK